MKHKIDGWDWLTDLQCLVLLFVLLSTLCEAFRSVLAAIEARSTNLDKFG